MQGIYTYIPETNHVPREHRVAAILGLLFMVLISLVPALTPLYLYFSTFRSMCAVPNMAVFCSFLTSWFPGMLLTYFIIITIAIPVITFTHAMYNDIPQINPVYTVYIVLQLFCIYSLCYR